LTVAGITASEAADCLRTAAVLPAPPQPLPHDLLNWIGIAVYERVYVYFVVYVSSDAGEFFFKMPDDDQRTFLLILAELIEV